MISNGYKAAAINAPTPSFQKGIIIQRVISFIEESLIGFQAEYINNKNHSEERTSQYLANYLIDNGRKEVFLFNREALQEQEKGNDRRVDIGVFLHRSDFSPFFTLEAKRLPTPGADREKEYVIGIDKKSGGIERYKLSLHGGDIEKSAIVGYVEKLDFSHWAAKINEWIEELISAPQAPELTWYQDDKLVDEIKLCPDNVSRFQAKHARVNKNQMHLMHYFIRIQKK